MKRYRPVIFISFYMIILIIIAAQLWGANGFLHPAIENINLYVRELRNTHAPLFHQSYDNYLQLLPGILLIGLKLGGVKGRFEWKRLLIFIVLSIIFTQLVVNSLSLNIVFTSLYAISVNRMPNAAPTITSIIQWRLLRIRVMPVTIAEAYATKLTHIPLNPYSL